MGIDIALLGAQCDVRGIGVAGKEIGQIEDVGIGDGGVGGPAPDQAGAGAEVERAAAAEIVAEIDVRAAILSSESHLVFA